MKDRKLIFTGLLLVGVAATVFFARRREKAFTLEVPAASPATATVPASPIPNEAATNAAQQRQPAGEERAKGVFEAIEGTNQPINFYGKVVDRDQRPLDGVKISYQYTTEHGNMLGVAWGQQKVHKSETASDAAGQFFIGGMTGHYLSIEALTKEGYNFNKRGALNYDYFGARPEGKFNASKDEPVVFVMIQNAKAELLIHYRKLLEVPGNGVPARWNLWAAKPDPNGELQVTLKRQPAVVAKVGQIETWDAQITLAAGGLVEMSPDESLYRAPEGEYTGSVPYPKAPRRRGDPNAMFYLQTAGNKYGRLAIRLYVDDEGAAARCYIEAWLNPKPGSRNLEPDSRQKAAAH